MTICIHGNKYQTGETLYKDSTLHCTHENIITHLINWLTIWIIWDAFPTNLKCFLPKYTFTTTIFVIVNIALYLAFSMPGKIYILMYTSSGITFFLVNKWSRILYVIIISQVKSFLEYTLGQCRLLSLRLIVDWSARLTLKARTH